jgi:hypothetical protein
MALTLGAQYLPKKLNADKAMLSFCPQVNFLYGFIHYFELGVGASYDVYTKSLTFPFRIGYRYQEQGGGIFFKIAATPMIVKADLFYTFKPWAGAAIGWTF